MGNLKVWQGRAAQKRKRRGVAVGTCALVQENDGRESDVWAHEAECGVARDGTKPDRDQAVRPLDG